MTPGKRWTAPARSGVDALRFVEFDVAPPRSGEVTIEVRAAGVNPADFKHLGRADSDDEQLIGYEVAGVLTALGPGTEIASGGGAVGAAVLAFRTRGGYATSLTLPARDVFAAPPGLADTAAANLLLAGTTAAEMLHVTGVGAGDTIVLHGASGAVGVSVLQQAHLLDVRVIGTAGRGSFDIVRRFGGTPVAYGDGLTGRLRALAPDGYAAALDAVGTDEAVDTSLALVAPVGEHRRIVTVAAPQRAERDGFRAIGGTMPDSAAFRDGVRARLIGLAAAGDLVVPVARTYPLAQAREALAFLARGHPGGKLALIP